MCSEVFEDFRARFPADVEEKSRPIILAQIPADISKKGCPKMGVSVLDFSADGRFLATRLEVMPATVWVWNVVHLNLVAVVVHCDPIKGSFRRSSFRKN